VRRRNFIALVGGAAAWPMATRAQQRQSVRIGVLGGYVVDDPEIQARIAAFRQGMQEQGWNEGSNLQIDYRWAGPDAERIKTFAMELVATSPRVMRGPTVILRASPDLSSRSEKSGSGF
jgi:putative ABC transport system substrate-binding protein